MARNQTVKGGKCPPPGANMLGHFSGHRSHTWLATYLVFLATWFVNPTAWAGGWQGWPPLLNEYDEHQFLAACRENRKDVVLYFIRGDEVDINGLYPGGNKYLPWSGLYLAAGHGHTDIVKLLLGHGADPNQKVHRGRTPLLSAAEAGHADVVGVLMDYGARVDHISDDGDSILYGASKGGNSQIMQRLLATGVVHPLEDPSKPILKKIYPLDHEFLAACREGHVSGVRYYLKRDGFDVDGLYPAGNHGEPTRGLYLAAGYGHSHIVKILLDSGAKPDQTVRGGRTALMNAVEFGHSQAASVLIEKGADINHISDDKSSVIYRASKSGSAGLVQQLVAAGAIHPEEDRTRPVLKNTFQEEPFLAACREGHKGGIQYYLELKGFDIKELYPGGKHKKPTTGLSLAAGHGHSSIVLTLLQHGADPDQKGYRGRTALMEAAESGHLDIVNILVRHGADSNLVADNGDTAVYLAAKFGHDRLVRYLWSAGAIPAGSDPYQPILKNVYLEEPFLAACREGHERAIRYYLAHERPDLNKPYPGGIERRPMTGLYLAAGHGHDAVVNILLSAGADPNCKVYNGRSALLNAVEGGHYTVASTLLKHGADMNHISDDGDSIIYAASKNGHKELVELLIGAGVKHPEGDPDKPVLKNSHKEHGFLAACREGHVLGIQYYLRQESFDINDLYPGKGRTRWLTGLVVAAGSGHNDMVNILLDHQADPNRRVYDGETPLMHAAAEGYFSVVNTLIARGADVHNVSKTGLTALHLAAKGGYHRVVRRLLVGGADPAVRCHGRLWSKTALDMARSYRTLFERRSSIPDRHYGFTRKIIADAIHRASSQSRDNCSLFRSGQPTAGPFSTQERCSNSHECQPPVGSLADLALQEQKRQ